MAIPVAIEQTHIKVSVDFYSTEEKRKLLAYPTATAITQIVNDGLEIPIPEFLTYFLFHQKRPTMSGHRTYTELEQRSNVAWSMLGEFLNFNGKSADWPAEAVDQLGYITEYIGESVGLSVINKIHGMTEADWTKIEENHGPQALRTFDYEQQASDGQVVVEVETKGSSVADNSSLSGPIYTHKSDIANKKKGIRERELKTVGPVYPRIRYGTITAVASQPGSTIKCWLVDPPEGQVQFSPRSFRLLNRMRFLRDWISFVSPQAQLATALATRVVDLEALADPFELSGVPLRNGTGEPFSFNVFNPNTRRHSAFMSNKSRVTNEPVGGVVVQISESALFFLGFREDYLTIASAQTFGEVLQYKAAVDSRRKTVECIFSEGRYRQLRLPPSVAASARPYPGYVRFRLVGQLHYSQEGLVFGVLPLPPK